MIGRLSLTCTKMEMVGIVGYWLIERRQIGINKQMVMTRVRTIRACGRHAHIFQAKMDGELGLDNGAVRQVREINLGTRSRRSWPSLRHSLNLNPRRHQRGRMWNVVLIGEQELQGVGTGRKRNVCLGLTGSKVKVMWVVGNRPVERRQVGIDQKMVMSRVRPIRASRGDTHVFQAKMNLQFRGDFIAVLNVDESRLRLSEQTASEHRRDPVLAQETMLPSRTMAKSRSNRPHPGSGLHRR